MRIRRTAIAFALSLALHLALAIALALVPAPERRRAGVEKPRPAPLRIALLHQAAPVPARRPEPPPVTKPAPPPPAGLAAPPAPKRDVRRATQAAPKPTAPEPRSVPAREAASSGTGSRGEQPIAAAPSGVLTAPDAPRALKLTPDPQPFVSNGPAQPEESGGRTIRNVPEELPDPEAVAAFEAEQARARVEGWINDELARLRVQNGLVDGWFSEMRDSLEKAAANPPLERKDNFVQQMAKSWLDSAQRYGQSGSPYGPGTSPERHALGGTPSPMERHAERFRGSAADRLQGTLDQGARLREFADGRFGSALLAIVEIRQSPQGELLNAALVESSGNKLFDTFVLKSAPTALETLRPPPPEGAGIRAHGIRSTWAFEGRVTYKKKLSDMDLKRDGWYLAGMLPLSLLTGSFDEVTGTVEVVDLRNPEFVCKVRLLKVY